MRKRYKQIMIIITVLLFLFILAYILYYLLYNGIIWFNNPSKSEYPVRGIDVSTYQGEIDWEVLSQNDIDFAFIKATEGSGMEDEKFAYNWEQAHKTDLLVGAYHFFSFDSAATTQAENFIKTVPKTSGMLPPVVDLEFYGIHAANPPANEDVQKLLMELLVLLEEHYGKKPIIYATYDSYSLYLENGYEEYLIWIRDIFKKPTLPDGRKWDFWQYSNRETLNGYLGREKYIDMNVFRGSITELEQFVIE